jgi:exodeoxyribonuclease VII large subunit
MENMENNLSILDPVNVLGRGYTITSHEGKIIKSINLLKKDDIVDTQFFDGSVTSTVLKKTKKRK